MDVKGAQALKERIDAAPDDDNRPDVRVLVNSVGFLVQRQHEVHARYDVVATGQIDRYGHISLDIPSSRRAMPPQHLAEYQAEVAERLCDYELAEWRAVGQGDTELYATQALLRLVAPALAALPKDWLAWRPSDG